MGTNSPIRGLDLVLIIALVFGSLFLVNTVFVGRLRLSGSSIVGMLALQTAVILGVIYLVAMRWRGAGPAELGLRPVAPKWYGWAVAMAFLVIPLIGLINLLIQALIGEPLRNPQIPVVAATGSSWLAMIGMVAIGGLAAPFAEELAFRGLLYGWLRDRFGVLPGAIVSAIAFSLLHGIPTLIPAIGTLGLVLALLYERSGSLWPGFVMHATFNIVMMVSLYAMFASGAAPGAP